MQCERGTRPPPSGGAPRPEERAGEEQSESQRPTVMPPSVPVPELPARRPCGEDEARAAKVVEELLGGAPRVIADRLLVDLAHRIGRLPRRFEARALLTHLRTVCSELAGAVNDLGSGS